MPKTCTYQDCTRNCYGDFCLMHKPRKPIPFESKKAATSRTGMKKRWYSDPANQPDEDGYWQCYLQIADHCPIYLSKKTLVHEHVIPKVKAPHLKFDYKNIKPACNPCNEIKASQTLEQLSEKYPKLKELL